MSDDDPCRRCYDCQDVSHHWIEGFDEEAWEYSPDPRPVWTCKHCEFAMPYCMDGFDSDDPQAMYEVMMRAKHTPPHATDPGGCLDTLQLFSDDDFRGQTP